MNPDYNIPESLLEEIDAYYDGDLSPEAAAELRKRIESDPELAAATARYEALYRNGFGPTDADIRERDDLRKKLHALESTLPPVEIARERRMSPRWLAAAAAVLLLLVAGWWLLDRPDAQTQLAQDGIYWVPREGAKLGPAEDAERGLVAYDQKQYEEAYPLLRDGIENGSLDSMNLLYAGISALGSGKPAEARELLTTMLETGQYPFDEVDLRYFIGLAELQLGNREAAIRQLESASELDGKSAVEARKILERLPSE